MDYFLALFDLDAYRTRVEPVLNGFFAGAPEGILLPLLEESNRRVSQSESLRKRLLEHNIEPGQSIIRILTGDEVSLIEAQENRPAIEVYVSGPVVYEILAALCIPDLPGIDAEQDIGDSPLRSHLIEHSAWIESAFTGAVFGKGEPLRFPLGLQSEILRRADVERLLAEVNSIPLPGPRPGAEGLLVRISNLQRMLEAGLADPKLGILFTLRQP